MHITFFPDRMGLTATPLDWTWEHLCERIANIQEYESKVECPLIKLARFGETRTERGSLRSDANVLGVWGCELDYDGETMSPERAHELLSRAGIEHIIYTSPSHTNEAPRWRALVPFGEERPPAERRAAVEHCNGVLGGVLARESFTLSQPFFVGRVRGGTYRTLRSGPGDLIPIWRREDLPRVTWAGAASSDGAGGAPSTEALRDWILAGVEVHPCLVALAFRGWSRDDLEDLLGRSVLRTERPARYDLALVEDIPRAVESAQRKRVAETERLLAAIEPPPAPVLSDDLFWSVGEMTESYEPMKWLIHGMIEHPSLVSVFGPSESGKSFVTIDMACCVALGRPWHGRQVARGLVVYLAGEGHRGLKRRFRAWKIAHDVSDFEWRHAPVRVAKTTIPLNKGESMEALWAWLDALPERPALIIVDTVNRHVPGMQRNDSAETSDYVDHITHIRDRYECTVVNVDHTGWTNQDRNMGSVVLRAGLDTEIAVRLYKSEGMRIRVRCAKQKDSAHFDDLWFKLRGVELPGWFEVAAGPDETPQAVTSAVLELVDAAAGPDETPQAVTSAVLELVDAAEAPAPGMPEYEKMKAAKSSDTALGLFLEIVRTAGEVGAKLEDARRDFVRMREGDPDTARKKFYAARRKALDERLVTWDEDMQVLRSPLA
jgi:hypothetical protein